MAPAEPVQSTLAPLELPECGGWSLEAVALYELTARVLHTKRYWSHGAELVPLDVALGWGRMSDETVLDQLSISQSNRFYFYEWQNGPPLPPDEIIAHSANVHIISGSDEVARTVRNLRRGAVVTLRGYLVNAHRADGAWWHTSLSRTDTGNGACELFYVDSCRAAP